MSCSDDEDWRGKFAISQANYHMSLKGKRGQTALRELETALLELPNKRLIRDLLIDDEGEMCVIGVYAKHKGVDLRKFNPEYGLNVYVVAPGMPRLAAWRLVYLNDEELNTDITPEERYERVLAWVRAQLTS